jgi:Flp pilus assembly pilin Flp
MKALLARLVRHTSGQDLIEYALIVAAISLTSLAGINALGQALRDEFNRIGQGVNAVGAAPAGNSTSGAGTGSAGGSGGGSGSNGAGGLGNGNGNNGNGNGNGGGAGAGSNAGGNGRGGGH